MNIKELIEKYELELKDVQLKFGSSFKTKVFEEVLRDLKQLDEPQKPVVKQFVADWYEENKDNLEFNIFDYVYRFDQNAGFDFKDWFDDFNTKPIQTLVNMHQFGYEVEKEKLVKVKLKGTGQYLCNDDTGLHFQHGFKTDFTKDYLKKYGFGWVFDCPGVEIEEVEE